MMRGFIILSLSTLLMGAISTQSLEQQVNQALRYPHRQAVGELANMGANAIKRLEQISFDQGQPMATRWKAFMAFTQIKGMQSLPLMKKALVSSTWYMRSAGLTALQKLDQQGAKKWAINRLLRDPALMVRMKAVEILSQDKSSEVTELFWRSLNSKINMKGNHSLWIRGDIAKILSQKPRTADTKRWAALLHGKDSQLARIAAQALARIAGSTEEPVSTEVSFWKKRYPVKSF